MTLTAPAQSGEKSEGAPADQGNGANQEDAPAKADNAPAKGNGAAHKTVSVVAEAPTAAPLAPPTVAANDAGPTPAATTSKAPSKRAKRSRQSVPSANSGKGSAPN
ncbi:MAG: hypothetical protein AAFW98_06150 [Pseudomonadota bacterium]